MSTFMLGRTTKGIDLIRLLGMQGDYWSMAEDYWSMEGHHWYMEWDHWSMEEDQATVSRRQVECVRQCPGAQWTKNYKSGHCGLMATEWRRPCS